MLLFHIFEKPSISNKTPSTSDEKPKASGHLDFDKKNLAFRNKNFEILGFTDIINTYYLHIVILL